MSGPVWLISQSMNERADGTDRKVVLGQCKVLSEKAIGKDASWRVRKSSQNGGKRRTESNKPVLQEK